MGQIVIAGLGGQGVVFLTRVLGEAAAAAGQDVICAENHGMAQRGGSVLAHVRIGPYRSPLVRRGQADLALCLSPSERDAAKSFLRESGVLVESTSNMEALGRAARMCATLLPPIEQIEDVIRSKSSPDTREQNLAAFQKGRDA